MNEIKYLKAKILKKMVSSGSISVSRYTFYTARVWDLSAPFGSVRRQLHMVLSLNCDIRTCSRR